ncbi:MAG: DUF167 domain-containing protein [Lentisphaeria bacterium]|nr:DUF167 domain-containing protein [Lentisphaeria bacterium]MBQ7394148.1 DUF167 domain-containing protein [Lentisphaeria bacterium]MBR2643058.1 DUF167 domain-containing protein [Lentisphaeria bacterium]
MKVLPSEAVAPDGKGGAYADLLIQPGASRTAVAGGLDGRIKIAVAAPPVDGKANEVLLQFLKKKLHVPKGSLEIISGETGRRKRVRVGMSPELLMEKLSEDA